MPYIPPDFDPESSNFNQYDVDWNEIMNGYGYEKWGDIIYPEEGNDPRSGDGFRSQGFENPEDALNYLYDAGLLPFSWLWWDEETESWHVYIGDSTTGE